MSAYDSALLDFRRRKDEHFAAGRGPVDAAAFDGLSYYPPDETWAFTLPLTALPQDESAEFRLETNTGEARVMARYGEVTVPLPGGERTLTVFAPLGEERPERVFVPFRDATSGQATYGAGRYLDAPLDRQLGGDGALVRLDFNLAYHPYCAYGDGWTCPLPPRENWLPDAVTAGEKLP
ncbi:DUF1684 domain-containing protein [Deinococcus taeanensis]|uniref:DUF1684 domain-containing protein n=1 Tax=Deinococcus taeanensis TaxID=2737050 RepID=UPI001CDD8494|nr:DUF1684 domain-containing protein [Deinococcus taeanensis]UBV42956.1 DUF1684 domain-containing protein [Deinococcus taeanensis]